MTKWLAAGFALVLILALAPVAIAKFRGGSAPTTSSAGSTGGTTAGSKGGTKTTVVPGRAGWDLKPNKAR